MSRHRKPENSSREKDAAQLERFKEMARELGADESPDALDKAFSRLDPRKRPTKPKDDEK